MKLNFNWGKGMVVAIASFMCYILFMVAQATQTNADLYAEDYYQQEIDYQDRINAITNARQLNGDVVVKQTDEMFSINFPEDFKKKMISGTIAFYRPDNASLDRNYTIEAIENQQFISKQNITAGRYDLKINCVVGSKEYFIEKNITIN